MQTLDKEKILQYLKTGMKNIAEWRDNTPYRTEEMAALNGRIEAMRTVSGLIENGWFDGGKQV